MGYKKLTQEQEKQIVTDYINGASTDFLKNQYGFATRKSITDKLKKYLTEDEYKQATINSRNNKKEYHYSLERIDSYFDAYFIGLLLTDGYITTRGNDVGIDLIDEDCIKFISENTGAKYHKYSGFKENRQERFRIILSGKELVEQLIRFGIVRNKTYTLSPPLLYKEEEKYIPYIIRGIIDGDGCVSSTSYNAPQFYIVTMSEVFADWCIYILENKIFMQDIHKRKTSKGLWRIESADYYNILKLISVVYDKPFGMNRKYISLRQTFNDYNRSSLRI